MPVIGIADMPAHAGRGRRLAGIDLGTRTIGIAVSDALGTLATPRPVLRRRKFTIDAEALLGTIDAEDAAGLVVGLPVNMDGSEGPRAQSTRAFVRNLLKLRDLPVAFWDERLSSVAAERALLEMDVSRARRAERIDSAAAAFILQGALDRLQALGASPSAK